MFYLINCLQFEKQLLFLIQKFVKKIKIFKKTENNF